MKSARVATAEARKPSARPTSSANTANVGSPYPTSSANAANVSSPFVLSKPGVSTSMSPDGVAELTVHQGAPRPIWVEWLTNRLFRTDYGRNKPRTEVGSMSLPNYTVSLGQDLQHKVAERAMRLNISEAELLNQALATYLVIADDADKGRFYSTEVINRLNEPETSDK